MVNGTSSSNNRSLFPTVFLVIIINVLLLSVLFDQSVDFTTAGEQLGREEPDADECPRPEEQSEGTVKRCPRQQGLNPM